MKRTEPAPAPAAADIPIIIELPDDAIMRTPGPSPKEHGTYTNDVRVLSVAGTTLCNAL